MSALRKVRAAGPRSARGRGAGSGSAWGRRDLARAAFARGARLGRGGPALAGRHSSLPVARGPDPVRRGCGLGAEGRRGGVTVSARPGAWGSRQGPGRGSGRRGVHAGSAGQP